MSDWVVNIPSYLRHETIVAKTLSSLHKAGVGGDRIRVFTSREEFGAYRQAIPSDMVAEIVAHDFPGVQSKARNSLVEWCYANGVDRMVSFDDDVRGWKRLVVDDDGHHDLVAVTNVIEEVIEPGWEACERVGATLWGLYPVLNPMFMRPKLHTKLSYVIGMSFGQILSGRRKVELQELDTKNDYERSLQHWFADGVLARMDWLVSDSVGYTGSGGLVATRTPEGNRIACERLMERYPGLVRWQKRARDWPEIRLVNPSAG